MTPSLAPPAARVLLVTADPPSPGPSELAAALAAVGAEIVATAGWPGLAARLDPADAVTAIVVFDAAGIATEALYGALAEVIAAVDAHAAPLIVSLAAHQLDAAGAALGHPRVQLLCDPRHGDWATALSLATLERAGTVPAAGVRESEAARLKRLNEEVARIAEVLARLSRREPAPGDAAEERRQGFAPEPPADPGVTAADLRRTIRARRLRDRFFGANLFEDPAWDMILDLFAAHLERAHVSVSSLCIAAAVAPTTALRWIGKLTEAGLFEREADPFDKRRAFIRLSERGLAGMRDYLAALREAELLLP